MSGHSTEIEGSSIVAVMAAGRVCRPRFIAVAIVCLAACAEGSGTGDAARSDGGDGAVPHGCTATRRIAGTSCQSWSFGVGSGDFVQYPGTGSPALFQRVDIVAPPDGSPGFGTHSLRFSTVLATAYRSTPACGEAPGNPGVVVLTEGQSYAGLGSQAVLPTVTFVNTVTASAARLTVVSQPVLRGCAETTPVGHATLASGQSTLLGDGSTATAVGVWESGTEVPGTPGGPTLLRIEVTSPTRPGTLVLSQAASATIPSRGEAFVVDAMGGYRYLIADRSAGPASGPHRLTFRACEALITPCP